MNAKTFMILDKLNRNWGSFIASHVIPDAFGHENIHGVLNPTDEFSQIKEIFKRHDEDLSAGVESDTWKEIVALEPYLIDKETNQILNINNTIFINHKLLVTCQIKVEEKM